MQKVTTFCVHVLIKGTAVAQRRYKLTFNRSGFVNIWWTCDLDPSLLWVAVIKRRMEIVCTCAFWCCNMRAHGTND